MMPGETHSYSNSVLFGASRKDQREKEKKTRGFDLSRHPGMKQPVKYEFQIKPQQKNLSFFKESKKETKS